MRYEDAIAKRDWDSAWALLAPEYRASSPGRAEFEAERSQFVNSTRGQYVVARPTHDGPEIRQWVTTRGSVIPVSPNYDRAFLARVDFPALSGNNAGWEELLVAPLADGAWFIWVLR